MNKKLEVYYLYNRDAGASNNAIVSHITLMYLFEAELDLVLVFADFFLHVSHNIRGLAWTWEGRV